MFAVRVDLRRNWRAKEMKIVEFILCEQRIKNGEWQADEYRFSDGRWCLVQNCKGVSNFQELS